MYVRTNVCMYVCICIYIYIHMYVYVCIHVYLHMYNDNTYISTANSYTYTPII